ncbi:tRNA(Met)-cytidine N(4)-acetyltransferase [Halospina denitrificans]|uniref:tRNA(Met) cytidine acetyltransferase TmcA n=1 Tax=Halospina denitrificans TaxID=332522 RepID=A0A4R7K0H3_9GAMM|nr:GNAT family N-acetyltransferase [Halospina denitrificans]TDT43926.1 tRNA(Met)-cytidine N(4)-acetyltransferase [Halospina denitrificans]
MEAVLSDWVTRARSSLARSRHRAVLVIAGPRDWGREQAAAVAGAIGGEGLWVGDETQALGLFQCSGSEARQWLGRDLELIVWDSHSGTHPSGLGAVSGALVGGGLLVWVVPPLDEWAQGPDPDYDRLRHHQPPYRFLARLARILETEAVQPPHGLITPEAQYLSPPLTPTKTVERPAGPTSDQQSAVDAILALARETVPAPRVLRADRGRGKSAALGMAASRLVRESGCRVGITAARPSALGSFWDFIAPESRDGVHFGAPDELLRNPPELDLLLVDEAATLPVPMLSALVAHWPRMALATTVHGYEGTGRGFDLRFRAILDRDHPGWQQIELTTPIRWAPDDPLEALMNRLLCLDADLPESNASEQRPVYEPVSQDQLLADEGLLSDLMGLLVSAHYQTSPDDLRQLLDDPDTELHAALVDGRPVGVAWVLHEGGLEEALARAVWLGQRRPRGHLMAQSLAFQGGDPEAARLRYSRVTRIAVHAAWRRRGIGLELLARVERAVLEGGADLLGVSFGATPDLLDFWTAAGFRLLRLGTRRDAASGSHAAMLGKPLTTKGETLCEAQRQRFAQHWPWLQSSFQRLEPELLSRLQTLLPEPHDPEGSALTDADRRELYAFVHGFRELEPTRLPLNRLDALTQDAGLRWPQADRQLWQRAVIDGAGWETLRREALIDGRRQGLKRLRELALQCLPETLSPGL